MECGTDCSVAAGVMQAAARPEGLPVDCLEGRTAGFKKVLIVEDYQTLQVLYREEFADEGYDVAICSECATLLDMIMVYRPDIILLDAMLGMHITLDMLRDIYAMARGALVLVHSAYPYEYLKNKLSVAAAEYLVKSADIQPVKEKLRSLAERPICSVRRIEAAGQYESILSAGMPGHAGGEHHTI